MAIKFDHIHLKSQDSLKTAQWYVDNLGAKIVFELQTAPNSFRLDLHGLAMNVTPFYQDQTHQQLRGIEHIAVETDEMDSLVDGLKANGARILEQTTFSGGRRVCFLESPDGVQLEIREMVK